MARQRRCRLCHKRPPWAGKNCPPGVCKACYHRNLWVDRPAARTERQAAAALNQDGDVDDDAWINGVIEPDTEVTAHDRPADDAEPVLPPWPIRRVTAGMKRCSIPDAEEIGVQFSDLLSEDRDPWAEAAVDILAAIQNALDGATPLFLVVDSDGLSPHYGRVTVTRGSARLLLWEGGGSVCDETIAATEASVVLSDARERAQRLVAAYPTQPDIESELAELVGAQADPWFPDSARRCKKHRSSPRAPRRCAACRAKSAQVAATARRLRARAARAINAELAATEPMAPPSED